jgi:hypothetical protein
MNMRCSVQSSRYSTSCCCIAGVRNELAVEYVHDISMRAKDHVFEVRANTRRQLAGFSRILSHVKQHVLYLVHAGHEPCIVDRRANAFMNNRSLEHVS